LLLSSSRRQTRVLFLLFFSIPAFFPFDVYGAVSDHYTCSTIKYDGAYCELKVEGWTVELNASLIETDPALARLATTTLATSLKAIADQLPPKRVTELRRILIWMDDIAAEAPHTAAYHPTTSKWPLENGFPAAKAGSVDLGKAKSFLNAIKTQPSIVMHELAHAFHELSLGYDNPRIRAAYEHAVQSGLYQSVRNFRGSYVKAYALTNQGEYFAELTESFYGKNDYFPFVRDELKSYDPVGFEAVRSAWEDSTPIAFREIRQSNEPCGASYQPSKKSRQRALLTVRNVLDEPVELYWIDFQSKRKLIRKISPGDRYTEPTFIGHQWLVEDPTGRCLVTFDMSNIGFWLEIVP